MKICWFGIYDEEYSRNKILIDGLRECGVDVIQCNYRGKGIKKYLDLIKRLRHLKNEYDYLFCAFPIHITVGIAFLFQRKPIIADAFVSQYESNVLEKRSVSKFHPYAFLYRVNDICTVLLAKFVLVDTVQNKVYFSKCLKKNSIYVVPVGVHTGEFFPIPSLPKQPFLVQFHGSYIPLQGIENIVLAANELRDDENILFRFIGNGQYYLAIRDMVESLALRNILFLPWLSTQELNVALNEADIILGIFGDTDKTERVVPNKVFQGLAVQKPVLTKDTKAIRTFFSEKDLFLTTNNPTEIAHSIIHIYNDQVGRMTRANFGYAHVVEMYSQKNIGMMLLELLKAV